MRIHVDDDRESDPDSDPHADEDPHVDDKEHILLPDLRHLPCLDVDHPGAHFCEEHVVARQLELVDADEGSLDVANLELASLLGSLARIPLNVDLALFGVLLPTCPRPCFTPL